MVKYNSNIKNNLKTINDLDGFKKYVIMVIFIIKITIITSIINVMMIIVVEKHCSSYTSKTAYLIKTN